MFSTKRNTCFSFLPHTFLCLFITMTESRESEKRSFCLLFFSCLFPASAFVMIVLCFMFLSVFFLSLVLLSDCEELPSFFCSWRLLIFPFPDNGLLLKRTRERIPDTNLLMFCLHLHFYIFLCKSRLLVKLFSNRISREEASESMYHEDKEFTNWSPREIMRRDFIVRNRRKTTSNAILLQALFFDDQHAESFFVF